MSTNHVTDVPVSEKNATAEKDDKGKTQSQDTDVTQSTVTAPEAVDRKKRAFSETLTTVETQVEDPAVATEETHLPAETRDTEDDVREEQEVKRRRVETPVVEAAVQGVCEGDEGQERMMTVKDGAEKPTEGGKDEIDAMVVDDNDATA